MTLTTSDFKQIRIIVKEELDERLDEKLTKLKSDLYERVDPILKEVTTA